MDETKAPHISVVIPVYKAEACLHELYKRLNESLSTITTAFEIIMVEDCGGDRSWEIIKELSLKDPRVRGIKFSRNFGQHYGISAGVDNSLGDWVVVMDCDLQDRPEEIPALYSKAQEGYDVVLAKRKGRKDGFLKRLTSWMFYAVFNYLSDMKYNSEIGNFRIISRKVAESFRLMGERLRFFSGLVDWLGYPTATVDVCHAERFSGKTTYTWGKLFKLALETIIAYSDKPLRISVGIGFVLSFFSFLYGTYIISRSLFVGVPVQGWSSLMVSIYFLCGIIIANLGIIGIYLGKTFDEAKRRPLYIIKERTVNDPA